MASCDAASHVRPALAAGIVRDTATLLRATDDMVQLLTACEREMKAGAYTPPPLSTTWPLSETNSHPAHSLNTPKTPSIPLNTLFMPPLSHSKCSH